MRENGRQTNLMARLLVVVVLLAHSVGDGLGTRDFSGGEQVKLVLLLIEGAELEVEAGSADDGEDGGGGVVPDEERIVGEGSEREAEGGGNGVHEETDGLDHGAHVGGSLGVGVFEGGDGGEDFGEGDEDVGAGLGPDDDWGWLAVLAVGVFAALALFVDVELDDGGPDHTHGGDVVAGGDTLDGGEVKTHLAEGGVDDGIHDGDHNDEGEGVEVGEDVVGDTADFHGGGLGDEVVVDLVVAEPVKWVVHEDGASSETTAKLINP